MGIRIPLLPDVVGEWRGNHPDEAIPALELIRALVAWKGCICKPASASSTVVTDTYHQLSRELLPT